MSRFNYKNNAVVKRTDTVMVKPMVDFPELINDHDSNRVQKVCNIRHAVAKHYRSQGYRDVSIRFVDGVIADLVNTNKQPGRPIPDVMYFDVTFEMPLVQSDVPVGRKDENYNYLKSKLQMKEDFKYWNDNWNNYE